MPKKGLTKVGADVTLQFNRVVREDTSLDFSADVTLPRTRKRRTRRTTPYEVKLAGLKDRLVIEMHYVRKDVRLTSRIDVERHNGMS